MKILVSFIVGITIISCSTLSAQTITTVAGNGTLTSTGDGGPAAAAHVANPSFGAFDTTGNYYFSEGFYSTGPKIRKINASGIITTVAGTGSSTFTGDGGPATDAGMAYNVATVDAAGNIYIADYYDYRVLKVDAITGIIHTIAGNGTNTSTGNGGLATAATLVPIDVCTDSVGNLFISDQAGPSIRKINAVTGIITQVANINAQGMCFDGSGNLLLGEIVRILKVNMATGVIDTIAGTGLAAYTGDETPAISTNIRAYDITADAMGNIYLADDVNQRVRVIDTFGIIHTVAGIGVIGFSGDGGLADSAELHDPEGLAVDRCGNLYVADLGNNRIRKVTFNTPDTATISLSCPASASIGSTVTVTATVMGASSGYTINWYNCGVLFSTTIAPLVTYTKTLSNDTITAKLIPTGVCNIGELSVGHVVTDASTIVDNLSKQDNISIYPNPAKNSVTVTMEAGIRSIVISDIFGQVLFDHDYGNLEKVELNVADFSTGVYVLKVNGTCVRKLVKK